MKKILILLAIALVLFLGYIYLFIPGEFKTTVIETFNAPAGATGRFISSRDKWTKWWPEYKGDTFTFAGTAFSLSKVMTDEINIDITQDGLSIPSKLSIISLSKDSSIVTWQSAMPAPSNPLQRMKQYELWNKAGNNMHELLHHLGAFLSKKENVYSINVQQLRVTDTLLVTTKTISTAPPTTADVYAQVKKLRDYISSQGATATNAPMLNINKTDSTHYQYMVGIPVNKTLNGNSTILFKRMVDGNILVSEVKGGPATIKRAFEQLELYVEDYRRIAPAISYEMLVTDRQQTPDTSAWFTRLYYPIL